MIQVLDQATINQIAAGEVIERPMAVVKELVENSMDAGATAITIEIKEGGISFIRVTDNGTGIPQDEVPAAFLPHATSKIRSVEDLFTVQSLGFRGEALSSIAAVAQVELITRRREEITGTHYEIEGGAEKKREEIGCPEGTTFIMRNLFYNTPARRKFLKTKTTEGNYIQDLVQRYTLGHPEIRFHFIVDGRSRLQTSGDGNLKTNIFYNYGADITNCLIPMEAENGGIRLRGFIGKPELSRGNRTFINYFVNGRYIKSPVITSAIEHAYKDFLMSRRYPFTALLLTIDSSCIDVNVHPSKMEARFTDQEVVYRLFYDSIKEQLKNLSLIPEVSLESGKKEKPLQREIANSARKEKVPQEKSPEPFEENRLREQSAGSGNPVPLESLESQPQSVPVAAENTVWNDPVPRPQKFLQERILVPEDRPRFRIIGQVFDTYWLVEYKSELLIIDQHAAHEKVLYEKLMERLRNKKGLTQNLAAPVVVTLSGREIQVLKEYASVFENIGFVLEPFGDREYLITGVPADFLNLAPKELFLEMLDSLIREGAHSKPEMVLDHCAAMACQAAVKGNNSLSFAEADQLFGQMLLAAEPFHCPHGRPTTIAMTRQEFEKKFKRII